MLGIPVKKSIQELEIDPENWNDKKNMFLQLLY